MSNSRTAVADALATLGTLIDQTARRDAIHLAVIPALAGEPLLPGEHVTARGIARAPTDEEDPAVGIVDPFLAHPIRTGQRFWLVLCPRTIRSLRHVWSHPAFPDEPTGDPADEPTGESAGERTASPAKLSDEPTSPLVEELRRKHLEEIQAMRRRLSENWLRRFCEDADVPGYEVVMEAIRDQTFEDRNFVDVFGSASGDIPPEFWDHAEIVLERKFPHRPTYFSCRC